MAIRSLLPIGRLTFLPLLTLALGCSGGTSPGTQGAGPTAAPAPAASEAPALPAPGQEQAAPAPTASQPVSPAASPERPLAYTLSFAVTPADFRTYVTVVNPVYNLDKLNEQSKRKLVEEMFVNHELALKAMEAGLQNRPDIRDAVGGRATVILSKFLADRYEDELARQARVTDEEVLKHIDEKLGEGVVLWTIAMADKQKLAAVRAELAAVPEDKRKEAFVAKAKEVSEGLTAEKGGALSLVSVLDTKIPAEYVKEFLEAPVNSLSELKPIHTSHYLFLVGEKRRRADIFRDQGESIRGKLFEERWSKVLADKLAELEKSLKVKIYWDHFEKSYQGPDKAVVAEVDGQPIRLNDKQESHGQAVFTPKQQINRYVRHLCMVAEAKRLGLDKTPDYRRVEALTVDREWRTVYLQTRGESYEPTEAEIQRYFQENTRSDLLEISVVKVSKLDKAKKVKALAGKRKFEDLVAEFSEDRKTREKKGQWARAQKGTLVPELESALFKLKAGEVSQPLPLDGGYCVFKVVTRSPSPYTELTPEVRLVVVNRLKLGRKSTGVEGAAREAATAVAGLVLDQTALGSMKF